MMVSNSKNMELWHKRLVHVPYKLLSRMLFVLIGSDDKKTTACSVCPFAKQARLPFPSSMTVNEKAFDLVHMDLRGPYNVDTYNGHKFFVIIVDDYSRITLIFLNRLKSNRFIVLKHNLYYAENQFSTYIKTLGTDNGTEFVNSLCAELFNTLEINHRTSYSGTPQQNGVVEIKNKTLIDTARTMLIDCGIPKNF